MCQRTIQKCAAIIIVWYYFGLVPVKILQHWKHISNLLKSLVVRRIAPRLY